MISTGILRCAARAAPRRIALHPPPAAAWRAARYSTSAPPPASPSPSTSSAASASASSASAPPASTLPATTLKLAPADPPEPRLSLTFTCTVPDCGTRSAHTFTRRAYERGIVLVQCPGCENRHLIADHLGWFKDGTQGGTLRTVEDLVRARGEVVRRGRLDAGGVVEYIDE